MGAIKYKVKEEFLNNNSKVMFERRGVQVVLPCDSLSQADMNDLLAACGGEHPILVEDKKADKA
jgi:hypothetical protein